MENPERLLLVTKWLYPDVANRYGTSWKSVERNIRTAANVAWESNKEALSEYAGFTLPEKAVQHSVFSDTCQLLQPRLTDMKI